VSIKLRIFLGFFIFLAIGLTLLTYWLLKDIRPQPLKTIEESLVETSTLLASLVEQGSTAGSLNLQPLRAAVEGALGRELDARIYELDKVGLSLRVLATDGRGIVVYDSEGDRAMGEDFSKWNDIARTLKGRYGARATRSDPGDFYSTVLFVAAPVRVGREIVGVVSVGKPVTSLKLFMTNASRQVIAATLVALLVAAVASLAIATWITIPLRRLGAYAEAVGRDQRSPMPALGHGEIATLGRTFEGMRDALEGKRYVESYVRALTHEIKGPLSAIRAAGELLEEEGMPPADRRRFVANIKSECMRLQTLIDRLLELAAVEARKTLGAAGPVDMTVLLQEVVGSATPVAHRKGVRLESTAQTLPAVVGDSLLLRQALYNLVQNAINATPSGGQVTLDAQDDARGVTLTVTDTGPGVPAYALPRVFDRFYSLTPTPTGTPGSGLGLPFVREVALLHGGEARLENRSGGGARATLRLALQPARRRTRQRPSPTSSPL